MKKLLPITLSLILGTAVSIATAAETMQPLPVVDVLQRLDQAGYHQIRDIEYKNGTYKVEAYGTQGQKIKFNIDARSMTIPSFENNGRPYLTMLQIARKLQGAGYSHIDQIEFDDNYYEIRTYDANGSRVKLDVNSITGEISKD
jgi:hypothetical protein